MMKKGITPVVTTILLLLIAVVVIGLAFVFFQRVMTNVTDNAGNQINQSTSNMGKLISIDNVNATAVVVRNIGSSVISTSDIGVYVNDQSAACVGWSGLTIAVGGTKTCNFPATLQCTTGTVRVTGPTNDDTAAC